MADNVPKDPIVVALAEGACEGGMREYGRIPNTPSAGGLIALCQAQAARGRAISGR
jgi:hypothetical protein